MPNVKIFADEVMVAQGRRAMAEALAPLREAVMRHLDVSASACQIAIVPVIGIADQPALNVELQILPAPGRSREKIAALGTEVQERLATATGRSVAFRCSQHDPASYVTLKPGA